MLQNKAQSQTLILPQLPPAIIRYEVYVNAITIEPIC